MDSMDALMIFKAPRNTKELARLVKQGEGPTLEFKRSTGELKEGMQTICAFLNGSGGMLLFGVRPDGRADGQEVSDQTLRDIAQAASRLEPPADLSIHRVKAKAGRHIITVHADRAPGVGPYTYDGRAFERVSSTTRRMPQAKYQRLLLDRAHSDHRWENEPAVRVNLRDIDRDEVFRIVNIAASLGRLSGPVGTRVADVLDRLRLRREGKILQAAMVLFGKEFMPDYPQCELRLARFKGTDMAEFMDQRQVRAPAFKLLEEAELFCQRHFPMPARIVPGQLRRIEAPLIPVDAMREILVNALIHRDYSIAGGAVSLAIFDDRVEVWSAGTFPSGITPEQLSRSHLSVQRNPLIADVFSRAGLIEKWGRGTNRVIAMCREAGIAPPTFAEVTGAAVVTFRVNVLGEQRPSARVRNTLQPESELGSELESKLESLDDRVLSILRNQPLGKGPLARLLGQKQASGPLHKTIRKLLAEGLIARTIPDKPNSRLQKYQLTEAGRQWLQTRDEGTD
jgi:ATP-dependent DNA helicase RecG